MEPCSEDREVFTMCVSYLPDVTCCQSFAIEAQRRWVIVLFPDRKHPVPPKLAVLSGTPGVHLAFIATLSQEAKQTTATKQ